jgi:ribonuclease P protein component
VLPATARLRASRDFTEVMRRGRRSGASTLTVHLLTADPATPEASARAGLIVSKAVGSSVVRHRVSRRLRHLLAGRLSEVPAGSRLVVRAAPAAGGADSDVLARDLDGALARLAR